jgi:hypothetical protein
LFNLKVFVQSVLFYNFSELECARHSVECF